MTEKILVIFEALPQVQTGAEIPEWFRVVPMGEDMPLLDNIFPSFSAGAEDFAAMIRAFKSRKYDMVIDYEHQTLKGVQAPAAGWVKGLEAREDGLWAKVEWTAKAREYLQNREYRYFSPVLLLNRETQRPLDIRSVALTNTPSIVGLEPLVAKAGAADDPKAAQQTRAKAVGMTITEEARAMKNRLLGVLALKAEATDDEIFAALQTKLALAGALPEIAQVLALKAEATTGEIIGAIKGLMDGQTSLAAMKAELTALKGTVTEQEVQAAVAEGLKLGKILPAEKEHMLEDARRDVAAFKARMEKRPVIGPPLKELPKQPDGGDKKGADGLTPDETIICKSLGLTAEGFKAEQKRLAEQVQ